MGWTDIPTFTYDQVVDETDMNTYVKDNLDYFKSDPVLDVAVHSGPDPAAATSGTVLTITPTIDAGVGAVYLRAWGQCVFATGISGHNNWRFYIEDAVDGVLAVHRGYTSGYPPASPVKHEYDLTSQDISSWAGSARTITLKWSTNGCLIRPLTSTGIGGWGIDLSTPAVSSTVLQAIRRH